MKVFQTIRRPLREVGIYQTQTIEESPFNWKNIFILLFLCQFIIFSMAYILFEAKNLREFIETFYILSTNLVLAFELFELTRKIYKIITSFEGLIGTRKLLMNMSYTFRIRYI